MNNFKQGIVSTVILSCVAVSVAHAQASVGAPDPDASALLGKSAGAAQSTDKSAASEQPVADPLKDQAKSPEKVSASAVIVQDYSRPASTRDPATVATLPLRLTKNLPQPKPQQVRIHEVMGPYDDALACVRTQLSPENLQTSFSVGMIRDATGQQNFVDAQGTGTFASQGADDMMLTALTKTGVIVVDSSQSFHQQVDWFIAREAQGMLGDGNLQTAVDPNGKVLLSSQSIPVIKGTIMPPNVLINGAVATLDFAPSSGGEITSPITIGHLKYYVNLTMDTRAVLLPRGSQVGGQIVVSDSVGRRIEGSQNELGLTRFFGPPGAATQVSFDIGTQSREALQAIERAMIDREAAVMVTKYFKITACDPQIEYGDELAFGAR